MSSSTIALIVIVIAYLLFKLFIMKKLGLKRKDAIIMLQNGGKIIDVRNPDEYNKGHVEGSLNIPHTEILEGIKKYPISQDTPLIIYCVSGMRSKAACSTLKLAGFTNVKNAGTLRKAIALTSNQ